MSFYNTYRPKLLADIDSAAVRKTVASLLTKKRDEIPHAYLLTGPRGTGKTTTARILAKLFNCQKPSKTGEPCGECEMCVSIGKGTAMDILEIDAASNTGVDNIRDLKDKILLAPSRAEYKVYIIDEVHMLSTGAFNALLKTLEEPPPKTVFILATTDLHKVPATIQSRCLMIQFQKPKQEEVVASLTRIVKAEKIKIPDELLSLVAKAGDGSFRDATKLLEEVALRGSQGITAEIVNEILSIPKDSELNEFISLLHQKNVGKLIEKVELFQENGQDIRSFFQALIHDIQKMMVDTVIGVPHDTWTILELKTLANLLHRRYMESRNTNFPELPLQLALLEYCEEVQGTVPVTIAPPVTTTAPHTEKETPAPKPTVQYTPQPKVTPQIPTPAKEDVQTATILSAGEVTVERLTNHWRDVIEEMKLLNHSIAGVLRSVQPSSLNNGQLVIETQYQFHKDKLSEVKAKEALARAMKKLFGVDVTIEILLIKK